jgi:hypothetical protein
VKVDNGGDFVVGALCLVGECNFDDARSKSLLESLFSKRARVYDVDEHLRFSKTLV